jgi:S1-C subfamily serine protease
VRSARTRAAAAALSVLSAAAPSLAQEGPGGTGELDAIERRTEELAKLAGPAVVAVTAVVEEMPAREFALPGLVVTQPAHPASRLEGTGFLVSADGHVATSFEMARLDARFRVRFADGTNRAATLVGADETFRVAVLKTAAAEGARPLAVVTDLEPGRRALGWFFGTPEDPQGPPVQLVAVRAATSCEGTYDRYLTAPVPYAAGAAGAPLVARDGSLLGMVVGWQKKRCALTDDQRGKDALFVAGSDVVAAADQIVRLGHVRRARLGVLLEGDTNRIEHVLPEGPAEKAGLAEGDVVVRIGSADVSRGSEVTRTLLRRSPGDRVRVVVRRGAGVVSAVVALDDVAMPSFPTTPPVAGATLSVAPQVADSGDVVQVVRVARVEEGGLPHGAGMREGDQVLSVDGRDVAWFLARHRVRPSQQAPGEIVVARDGGTVTIALRR